MSCLLGARWYPVEFCVAILEDVIASTRSLRYCRTALKLKLIECLICATNASEMLNPHGRTSILAFVREILPDLMLFRSVLKCSDGLLQNQATRWALARNADLGEDWSRLFALYDFRNASYSLIPRLSGNERMACGNVRLLVRSIHYNITNYLLSCRSHALGKKPL